MVSASSSYKKTTRLVEHGTPAAGIEISNAQYDWEAEVGIIYIGIEGHRLQVGVQTAYEDNFDIFYTISDPDPRQVTLVDKDTYTIGAYLSDTFQATDKLILVGGLRADHNTLIDQNWVFGGRLAVIYHATSHWTTKLMYNHAVRMPNPMAALNQDWGIGGPGPDWATVWPVAEDPEQLATIEWQNIVYAGKTRLSLTLYHQELKDYISWAGPHTNIGDFAGHGTELSIEHRPTQTLSLWANASYVDATFDTFQSAEGAEDSFHTRIDPDQRLVGSSRLTMNVGVDYHLTEATTLSSTVRYFTKQSAQLDPTGDADAPGTFAHVNDQFYLDASLLYQNLGGREIDLRISGKNLLDNRDLIAGAWLGGLYRPRGASVDCALYFRF